MIGKLQLKSFTATSLSRQTVPDPSDNSQASLWIHLHTSRDSVGWCCFNLGSLSVGDVSRQFLIFLS